MKDLNTNREGGKGKKVKVEVETLILWIEGYVFDSSVFKRVGHSSFFGSRSPESGCRSQQNKKVQFQQK